MDLMWIAVVAVVAMAGLMRGITGFGGAMLMAPPLSIMLGPVPAVVTTLVLETAAAAVMFRDAWPRIRVRTLAYLTAPACLTVPLGGYLLLTINPEIARRLIAAIVVVFSLLLLTGLRYSGTPRPATSVALGGLVGVLLGATSVGAPPVILYLLSGPDPVKTTRAHLTVFVTAISVIGLVMFTLSGVVTAGLLASSLALAAPFLAATWLGGRMFGIMSETAVRRIGLGAMLLTGTVALLL